MKIVTIPAGILETNCYLVQPDGSRMLYIIDPGGDAPEIAQALKLSDFVYRKTAGSVRSLVAPEILAAYQRCVDADFQFKSGQIGEQAALDRAIFTLHALFARGRKEGKSRAR